MQLISCHTTTIGAQSDNLHIARIIAECANYANDCDEYAASHIYGITGDYTHGETVSYDDNKSDSEIITELLATIQPAYLFIADIHNPQAAYIFLNRGVTIHILHFSY